MKNEENGNGNPKTMPAIYDHFSQININKHLEKKGNLDYLQWAVAVRIVKEFDPGFTFSFNSFNGKGVQKFPADGEGFNTTAEVQCTINCCGYEFTMWLPVMDHKFKAIVNPSSKDINDTKMRCLVKNISVNLGLGSYVYEGFKAPGLLKLENEARATSDNNSFAPMMNANSPVSQNFVSTVTDGVAVSPDDESDVRNNVVLIGYGASENKTYAEVYGSNIKNINSQIEWVKANGNGDKASQHLANLCQYKLLLTTGV